MQCHIADNVKAGQKIKKTVMAVNAKRPQQKYTVLTTNLQIIC